jgi:hypothetical protein
VSPFGLGRNPVVRRRRDGRFDVVLDGAQRRSIALLLGELDELIEAGPDDPGLERLRPPAYLEDADKDAEYQLLAGDELRTSRRRAIAAVVASLEAEVVTDEQLWAWVQSLNALRLVVGTRLGIDDDEADERPLDPDDPAAGLWTIYHFATALQSWVVSALRD